MIESNKLSFFPENHSQRAKKKLRKLIEKGREFGAERGNKDFRSSSSARLSRVLSIYCDGKEK